MSSFNFTKYFEKGMRVRVTDKLIGSHTEARFKLDSKTGRMIKMQGKVFPIHTISSTSSIRLKDPESQETYIFDARDVTVYEEETLPPKIFEFNPEHLDMEGV